MSDDKDEPRIRRCKGIKGDGKRCTRKVVRKDYCSHHRTQNTEAEDPADGLNRKQRLFVEFYLSNGLNIDQAADQAGYDPKYARDLAYTHGTVRATIEKRLKDAAMSTHETLARLTEFGRATVDHFVDADGNLDLSSEKARRNRALIKEIVVDKFGAPRSVKLQDPQRALQTLAKAHGLLVDRVEHSGEIEHTSRPAYDLSRLTDDELDQFERLLAKVEIQPDTPVADEDDE